MLITLLAMKREDEEADMQAGHWKLKSDFTASCRVYDETEKIFEKAFYGRLIYFDFDV